MVNKVTNISELVSAVVSAPLLLDSQLVLQVMQVLELMPRPMAFS